MKFSACIIAVTCALVCSCTAGDVQSQPRYVAVVTCFNGKLDSGSSCSAKPAKDPKNEASWQIKRELTCGSPGKVSEVQWQFVGQKGDADVYQVTRRFPSDTPGAVTATNTVSFTGKRVTVFEDKDQVIVIGPPKK